MRLGTAGAISLAVAAGSIQPHHNPAIAATPALHYHNPVFNRDFPDPMVLRSNAHSYWAYGTTVGWSMGYFPILHSTDFVHWRYIADAFKSPPNWANGDFWAPDVVKRGKTYYLYYVGKQNTTHCIAVATSLRPQGPFRTRTVIACHDRNGVGLIDPDLFIDVNGKAYLYVSVDGPHRITVFRMKSNLLQAADAGTPLLAVSQPWESRNGLATVEGPFLIRHSARYYLFYSGNSYVSHYGMGFASASSPLGPFIKYGHNPVLIGNRQLLGPGGGSLAEGPDLHLWLVYHAWSGGEPQGSRTLRIDPVTWRGTVPVINVHPK